MLKELTEINGVSGDEDRIRNFIKEKIHKYADEIIEDDYGNLVVRKGKVKKTKILLAAHMDEVGMMITGIEKNGLLKFKTIGLRTQSILAKRVLIGEKKIPGIIGHKPVHLLHSQEKSKVPEVRELFIDIGASSKEEAEKIIQIGDMATFDTKFTRNGDLLFGKAFDNRLGCFILIELISKTDIPAYYAFTVQEELGLRGARVVSFRINPDVAIAVDTTASGEFPEKKDLPMYPAIGKGPALTIADASILCDRNLLELFERTAQKYRIPYQHKQPMVGGTDAGVMHLTRDGVPAMVISTPARYIHSPISIASIHDIKNSIKLLSLGLEQILKESKWN
ncbi:MAG: M42 family metallopeptidase [candidate division WOR-3 bacterium]|nr:M42 family metallopeptidase [candidate division WOR-3 bacterium]